MRTNLELKARYRSATLAKSVCRRIGATPGGILRQEDTYFRVPQGRLKLREINGREVELIFYRRADSKGTRYSDFLVVPLVRAQPMKDVCKALFGISLIVQKKRSLYLFRNARIHIDSVKDLGEFIEFEVIVDRGKRQARQLMSFLISEFQIEERAVIGESYSDLLGRRRKRRRG